MRADASELAKQFLQRFTRKNDRLRIEAARDLLRFIVNGLHDHGESYAEDFLNHFDDIKAQNLGIIHGLMISNDTNDKKAGVFLIVCLVETYFARPDGSKRVIRFYNWLRNDGLNSSDPVRFAKSLAHCTLKIGKGGLNVFCCKALLELVARAMTRVALVDKAMAAQLIGWALREATEALASDAAADQKKHEAAVFVCREFALGAPTLFFQKTQDFFLYIFKLIRNSKLPLRLDAISALRAALFVASTRETKQQQKTHYYKQCYDEMERLVRDAEGAHNAAARDDRLHAALLLLLELMRIANRDFESKYEDAYTLAYDTGGSGAAPSGGGAWRASTPSRSDSSPAPSRGTQAPSMLHYSNAGAATSRHRQHFMSVGDEALAVLCAKSRTAAFESRTCRKLVMEQFELICELSLKARGSRSPLVQAALVDLYPRLASFDAPTPANESGSPTAGLFTDDMLSAAVDDLLQHVQSGKERTAAFIALGLLVSETSHRCQQHMEKIFDTIKNIITKRDSRKRGSPVDLSVFSCTTLIVRSMGTVVETHLRHILDAMFNTGLSEPLTRALRECCTSLPLVREEIHDSLLRQLSLLLMRRPLPSKLVPPGPIELPDKPVVVPYGNVSTAVLALNTLGSFRFQRHSLEPFLKYVAQGYLSADVSDDLSSSGSVPTSPMSSAGGPLAHALDATALATVAVRRAAVQCTCQLLMPFVSLAKHTQDNEQKVKVVLMLRSILNRLIAVGVSDPFDSVRVCVFECLLEAASPLSVLLAQASALDLVLMAVQDECYEIRETVVCLLGRLSTVNPAHVMPALRTVVVQTLSQLTSGGVSRTEEEAARLLAKLAYTTPKFMKPYMSAVLETLIAKLKDATRSKQDDVLLGVINAIGELATVGGPDLMEKLDELLPRFIEYLQDASSLPKREVSLWAFGQVVQNSGYVVDPYRKYPQFLDLLLRFIRTEQSPAMRRETLRVLGICGALDPYQHKVFTGCVESAANSTSLALSMPSAGADSDPRTEILTWYNYERFTLESFYPAYAIANLMHILQDPSLGEYHQPVVQAVKTIFYKLGSNCAPFVDQVIPRIVSIFKTSRDSDKILFLFGQLAALIRCIKFMVKPYLLDIFIVIKSHWNDEEVKLWQPVIEVVKEIGLALGADFKPYVPEMVPYMMRVLTRDDSPDKTIISKVLNAFVECSDAMQDHLYLIVPPLVSLIDDYHKPYPIRKQALFTLSKLGENSSMAPFGGRIMHALVRAMRHASGEGAALRPELHTVLNMMVRQMGKHYLVFRPAVEKVMAEVRWARLEYDQALQRISMDPDGYTRESVERTHVGMDSVTSTQLGPPQTDKQIITYSELEKTWDISNNVSKEDWTEWLKQLREVVLRQSPTFALRSCAGIAASHEPLARHLFNAAFMSIWTELAEPRQEPIPNIDM